MKQWKIKKADSLLINELSENLGISDTLSRILVNRSVNSVSAGRNFLYGTLDDLHNWRLLPDIDKAAGRIKKAVQKQENILIYGDYDVDGISACVLLQDFLAGMGAKITYYIPDRIEEGYGLNKSVLPFVKKHNISLVITVDCGVSAFEEVEFLNKQGVEIIVTDHHKPKGDILPPALAVICPQRQDCEYPFRELSGVGVAFKVAQALSSKTGDLFEYLDLVALGTVADVVPLVDENRILVREGLKRIVLTKREGLKALIKVSGLEGKDIYSRDIGYILGPRINASGRLGTADRAVKLLMTDNKEEAELIADELHKSNRQRQRLQEQILNEALTKVEQEINFNEQRVIVLEDEGWHPGLIGIIASRITQEFYRPSVIISTTDSPGKGSGRSIKNFHLFQAISKCGHLLEDFGGHEGACGISILKEKIKEFSEFINKIAHNILTPEDLSPSVEIDAEIPLSRISLAFIDELGKLAPFGCANPKPLFLSRELAFKNKPVRFGRNHFKGWVTDGKNVCEAVGFGMSSVVDELCGKKSDMVYYPSLNEWKGMQSISLYLDDVKISG